jgi:hypothetical protein
MPANLVAEAKLPAWEGVNANGKRIVGKVVLHTNHAPACKPPARTRKRKDLLRNASQKPLK